MSNFLIFKASFNNSASPAIGTYTVEGGAPQFIYNSSLSNYYMYVNTAEKPIKWFIPTAVVTDFEFVCDILTRDSNAGYAPYFTIADSNGMTKLRMETQYSNIRFMSDDTHGQSSSVICLTGPNNIGGFDEFHQFRIRVRKLTDNSSSVEVYVNNNLVTSGTSPSLITCGKISFLGATGAFVTGKRMGIKNAYVYDLSNRVAIDRNTLSNAFTRFIGWAKNIFALKSDVPTVNNGTLTIQQNGTTVKTFTANASSNVTCNITVPTKTSDLTNDSGFLTSADVLPVGSYIQFAGSQAPEGFLVCNGSAISRTTYSALFAVIGTTYGSGDGSTTFNLPNLINRFLEGSTKVGTVKKAGLPNITGNNHALYWKGTKEDNKVSGAFYSTQDLIDEPVGSGDKKFGQCDVKIDASRSNSIYGNSTTVQPPALTCLICIKY